MTPVATNEHGGFGWKPDKHDPRDHDGVMLIGRPVVLPQSTDLRHDACMPTVWDQGQLGSCTAHSVGASYVFGARKAGHTEIDVPSRLFIYYNERDMEGTTSEDAGAEIRDGMKSVAKIGAPPEADWPYDVDQFAVKPPQDAYDHAESHKLVRYAKVQRLNGIKQALAQGFPVAFGFQVMEVFESPNVASTGIVPKPTPGEESIGGHAVLAVGYDEKLGVVFVRNSWGESWGQDGYFELPYDYWNEGLCSDFWVCQVAS